MAKNKKDKIADGEGNNLNQEHVSESNEVSKDLENPVFVEEKKADETVSDNETKKRKRNKRPKKPYEKTTFTHKMKVLGVLLVLGIFSGSGLGVWYFNYELRSTIDYGAYDPADYIQTVNATFKKNGISATEKDGLAWLDKVGNLTPADLTPADNFLLAEHNLSLANSYDVNGIGYVDSTGVRQSIISRKRYNGKYYTFESISPSKISFIDDIILCDKYVKNSKTVSVYSSKKTNPTSADWKHSHDLPSADYLFEAGNLPSVIQPYIISEKTVLEPTNDKANIVYNAEDDTYSFTMQLESTTSVLNYTRQVKRTGGLGSYPEFTSISFSAVIDADWNLISFSIKEKYSAVKGIRASCTGVLNYTITINHDVEMPV